MCPRVVDRVGQINIGRRILQQGTHLFHHAHYPIGEIVELDALSHHSFGCLKQFLCQRIGDDDASVTMLQVLLIVGLALQKLELVEVEKVRVGELESDRHFLFANFLAGGEAVNILIVHHGTHHLGTFQLAEDLLHRLGRIARKAYVIPIGVGEVAAHIDGSVPIHLGVDVAHADVQHQRHNHRRGYGDSRTSDVDGGELLVLTNQRQSLAYI